MDALNYYQARTLIATGDLIAFRQRRGLLHWLIRRVTRSPYTHTAIAVWVGVAQDHCRDPLYLRGRGCGRLLVAEAKLSGAMLTPLSQYAAIDFDVLPYPGEVRGGVESALWRTIGRPTGYDVLDLVRIAAHRLFGRPLPARDNARRVCSALSAEIWLRAGWKPKTPLPSIPAPDDVVAARGEPVLRVRST